MDRKKSHEKSFAEIVKQADEVKQTKSELQSKIQGMAKVLEEQRADIVQEQGIVKEGADGTICRKTGNGHYCHHRELGK